MFHAFNCDMNHVYQLYVIFTKHVINIHHVTGTVSVEFGDRQKHVSVWMAILILMDVVSSVSI